MAGGVGGIGEVGVGEVGVGRGDASSEGEHADASDARRTQAARHITMIHLHRRVLRITPLLTPPLNARKRSIL